MDNVIDALLQKGDRTMFITPLFKDDYPNLMLGSTGFRHMLTIKCVSGYVTIEDFDIGNCLLSINAHNGNGYIGWKTL